MPEQREARRGRGDRKHSPQSNNLLWYLVVVGIGMVLLLAALMRSFEHEIPYSKLVELIKQGSPNKTPAVVTAPKGSGAPAAPRITVEEATSDAQPRVVAYWNLTDLRVGPDAVTGKVTRQVVKPPEPNLKPREVRFRSSRRGLEQDDAGLINLLTEHGFQFRGEDAPSPMREYAWVFLLLAGFLIVLMIVMRRLGGAGSPMAFGRSRGKLYAQEDIGVTFDDVAGVDEAVDELREVVEFLKTPEKYQVLGGRIPKGVLLVGPPGTGKTLLAKAIAGEAGVPFFSLSGSDFVEMFVGVGAARVRDMFQQAEAKAPCIIFIDELDALGKTRGSSVVGGHDEREQTLNALLVEMDGFDSTSGVIVMAATNRPETLDPALLRPGRFDRNVLVDRPDVRGREKILKVHTQNVKLDASVELSEIAQITVGFVGADLANLVNEAALLAARKAKTAVGRAELTEGVERVVAGLEKKQRVIHVDEKQRIAYHESGHALVGYCLPNTETVHKVSIIPRGMAMGYVLSRPDTDRYLVTQSDLESHIQVLLAGTVAEELIYSDISTGAQNDLERASEIARSMVMDYGMSRLGRVSYREASRSQFLAGSGEISRPMVSEQTAREIDQEVQRIIQEMMDRTRRIIDERQPTLRALAARLMEKEVIDAGELKEIIESTNASPMLVPGTESPRPRVVAPEITQPKPAAEGQ